MVVRRKTAVDAMHERGELGSHFHPQKPDGQRWDPYNVTKRGLQMRGGRLYKIEEDVIP
jgi:hypothetical protein